MARKDLSEGLIAAGRLVLEVTDSLGLAAEGAMWIYSHELRDWRFYLVTSLVDTMGRRKVYQLLMDAVGGEQLPGDMTLHDIHLGSPSDPMFVLVSRAIGVAGPSSFLRVENCRINGVQFDGGIYRTVSAPLAKRDAARAEKLFGKRVKNAAASRSMELTTIKVQVA